jgi:hypothetical protein
MVVKMRSKKKIKQMVLPVPDNRRHKGCLIGNSNTGRLHSPDCSAIDMMTEDHKIPTDGCHFTPCGWCHACGGGNTLNINHSLSEDLEGTEICMDKKVNQLFHQTGCLSCGSKNGVVKMFPDTHGVRLLGREGHWWIYFECACGYQTAWWKAKNHLKTRRMEK